VISARASRSAAASGFAAAPFDRLRFGGGRELGDWLRFAVRFLGLELAAAGEGERVCDRERDFFGGIRCWKSRQTRNHNRVLADDPQCPAAAAAVLEAGSASSPTVYAGECWLSSVFLATGEFCTSRVTELLLRNSLSQLTELS
jgi:hypothetical protein